MAVPILSSLPVVGGIFGGGGCSAPAHYRAAMQSLAACTAKGGIWADARPGSCGGFTCTPRPGTTVGAPNVPISNPPTVTYDQGTVTINKTNAILGIGGLAVIGLAAWMFMRRR